MQIDRGGAGGPQRVDGDFQRVIVAAFAKRDGQSVGGGGADQGRATYLHGADGVRRFSQRGNAYPVQRMRQSGLINDVDDPLVRMGAQGAGRDE